MVTEIRIYRSEYLPTFTSIGICRVYRTQLAWLDGADTTRCRDAPALSPQTGGSTTEPWRGPTQRAHSRVLSMQPPST